MRHGGSWYNALFQKLVINLRIRYSRENLAAIFLILLLFTRPGEFNFDFVKVWICYNQMGDAKV